MAFTANFSVSQGVDVTSFQLQDTSTGSDPALTERTISLIQTDGTLLGGATIAWPLSMGSTITISGLLTRDYSLNILVVWTSSAPIPGSTYTKNAITTFTGNSNDFAYSLIQQIASNQAITQDTNYLYNLALVNSDILNAERANTYADQTSAQLALNRIYNYIINQAYYF
jgi:hypothetical protein